MIEYLVLISIMGLFITITIAILGGSIIYLILNCLVVIGLFGLNVYLDGSEQMNLIYWIRCNIFKKHEYVLSKVRYNGDNLVHYYYCKRCLCKTKKIGV